MPTSALNKHKNKYKCGLDYSGQQHVCLPGLPSDSSSVLHKNSLKNKLFLMRIHQKRGAKEDKQQDNLTISINISMHIAFIKQRTWTMAFAYALNNPIRNIPLHKAAGSAR